MWFGGYFDSWFGGYFGATSDEEPPVIPTDRGDGVSSSGGYIRHRRAARFKTRDQLEKLLKSTAKEPPPPTKKRIKAIEREIVEEVSEGLGAPEKRELTQFVHKEVVQFYEPEMNWVALARAYEHLMMMAAEKAARLEQEIEEEDEMLLLSD